MTYYIGNDVGNTKTNYALVDADGNVLKVSVAKERITRRLAKKRWSHG